MRIQTAEAAGYVAGTMAAALWYLAMAATIALGVAILWAVTKLLD